MLLWLIYRALVQMLAWAKLLIMCWSLQVSAPFANAR